MKRVLVICHLTLVICLSAFAQSNVTYELKVGTTGENALLADFPESYAGEKINIKLSVEHLALNGYSYDFIFANEAMTLADSFDSIYSYSDEIGTSWTVGAVTKRLRTADSA